MSKGASPFGNSDPTQDALSPWLWLPLVMISVCCVLFISLRRAQSLLLLERFKARLHLKFPFLFQSPIRSGNIRLPHDLENSLGDDSDSDDGNARRHEDLDDEDELPRTAAVPRSQVLAERGRSWLETLSRGLLAGGGGGGVGNGRTREKEAGIAQAFWGTRVKDRTGGIRLGGNSNGASGSGRGKGKKSTFGSNGPLLQRVPDAPFLSSPTQYSPTSPRASSSPNLFDLGEEEDEEDAVELPRDIELPEERELGAWGSGDIGASARVSSGGFPSTGFR